MTTTLDRSEVTFAATLDPLVVLDLLVDAVTAIAPEEPDRFDSALPAGREVLGLAALGRAAAAELGAAPGVDLTDAPGVVVVRDLAAVVRQLARAIAHPGGS